ncbi:hypothetical protein NKJ23_16015 [Mesorhizobium sp. M0184]|uniref:hypothetical protein n=1 Tax=Mesorhizobium sp. M0184 TaxID=2956906 RepID=UPI00333DC94A
MSFHWFRKAKDLVSPLPDLRAVPDQTHAGLTMDWLIAAMAENKEVPRVGDVIVEIQSCSMGMTVRRDIRHRVTGPARRMGCADCVPTVAEDGSKDTLSVFYMRRHKTLARTWTLMN